MEDVILEDEYGKRTRFTGTLLASESTEEPRKPQWAEMSIWKTAGGQYVLERKTIYRYRHLNERCYRIGPNQITRQPTESDVHTCPNCNPREIIEPGKGFGIQDRVVIDIARDARTLIDVMANTDRTYSGFAKEMLATVSEQDEDIRYLWMEVTVE